MKDITYRVEWCEYDTLTRYSQDFAERTDALAYRRTLKLTRRILWSSVCKVE